MPTARSSCAARRWEMSEMPSRRTCSPASGSPPAADPALSRARARAWPRIVARTRLGTETVARDERAALVPYRSVKVGNGDSRELVTAVVD